jgi:serine/threonine protein kinase/Tfp pilus assembly protein PilF
MEYIEGKSLRDVINEYKLGLDKIIDIIRQLSEGLSKAHKAGIVHRDIKPENIIIDHDARVKILDFGLAKLKGVSKLTKETSTLGTINYMSPEQIQGKEIDHRSDIWSLGIVFYELLFGEAPFKGEYDQAVSYAIINEKLNLAQEKDTPRELIAIIERCLNKNPDERYQNAKEIVEKIDILKDDSSHKLIRQTRTNKLRYLKIAILVLIALVAIIISIFVVPEAEREAPITIAVTDIVNDTGENELNGLSSMLTTALDQSKRLKVIIRSRMFDILKQLNKENIEFIDEKLGKEIAVHAGINRLVLPSVQKLGQIYIMDIKIINPQEEEYIFTNKESGEGQESIYEMIDLLAEKTREHLEESKEEIRQSVKPVAEITTINLEAYYHYYKGNEFVDKMMFMEAETEFRRAIELDSTFGIAYYRLAYALDWEANEEQAKIEIDKAYEFLERIPEKEQYLVRFVKTVVDHGWGLAGLNILREMEKRYPDDKEMIYNIGDVSYHLGNYSEAIKYLENILVMDSTSQRTLQHLCWTYRDNREYEKALFYAKKYLNLSKTLDAHAAVIDLYLTMGDEESAQKYVKYFENTEDMDALFGLANQFYFSGHLNLGKRFMEIVYSNIESFPNREQLFIKLFMAAYSKNPQDVIRTKQQLIEDDKLWWAILAIDYVIMNQFEEAAQAFQKVEELYSGDVVLYGYTLHKLKNHQKEEEIYTYGLNISPGNPDIIFGQAVCACSQRDTVRLNDLLIQYQSIRKENNWSEAAIVNSVGSVYEEGDNSIQAEKYYRRAVKLEPDNIWYMHNLAYLLIDRERNVEEGMEIINEVLQKFKDMNKSLGYLKFNFHHKYPGIEPVGYWKILDTYGWGLYKQGKYKESLDLLNQAIDHYRYYEHIVHEHIDVVTNTIENQNKNQLN